MNAYGITPLDYCDFWRDILISLQIFLYILNAVEEGILPYMLEEQSTINAARMFIIAT